MLREPQQLLQDRWCSRAVRLHGVAERFDYMVLSPNGNEQCVKFCLRGRGLSSLSSSSLHDGDEDDDDDDDEEDDDDDDGNYDDSEDEYEDGDDDGDGDDHQHHR